MRLTPLLAWAAVLVAAGPIGSAQPARAQAERDWAQVVDRTEEGGFRMGNPNAPVRLVWFTSLTCVHCANFAAEGAPNLVRRYVSTGEMSFEIRNFVLNPFDLAATFLSRCAAPRDYFALTSAILAGQSQWVGRLQRLRAEQYRRLSEMDPMEALPRIVRVTRLDAMAERHGISEAEARACLRDRSELDRILEMRRAGEGLGVTGTPSFTINGRLTGVHDWRSLEPLLRAALRTA